MRRKRIFAWFIVAAAGVVLAQPLVRSDSRPAAAQPPPEKSSAPERRDQAPQKRFAALPAREPMSASQGELFGPRSWDTPAPQARKPLKPAAPAMPYRVAGQVTRDGGVRVVLAKADRIYEVREGDTLEDGYRVESIQPDAVTLVYLPLARRERLQVSGAALRLDPAPASSAEQASAAAHSPALTW